MKKEIISYKQALSLIRELSSISLSRIWRGYGTAIFLEFGKLTDGKGEYTLTADSGWRINLKGVEYIFNANWNTKKFENALSEISPLPTETTKLTENQLDVSFGENVNFVIDLNNLKNTTWSLSSKLIGGYLYTEDGEFFIEKEG